MSTYRLWIRFSPDNVLSAQPRGGWLTITQCVFIAATLTIPAVERVVGVAAVYSAPTVLLYAVWVGLGMVLLVPRARRSPLAFHLLNVGDVFLGVGIAVALPIASGNPTSPLWTFAVMFAAMNGADYDYGASVVILLAHALSPLVSIPFYWAWGVDASAAIGGPLFFAMACAVSYHFNAVRGVEVRKVIAERDELRHKLAEETARHERERIARDLHDSVGASLSTAALYADMLVKGTNPESVRHMAEAIATTTREGILELRGLLDAIHPDDLDALAFCEALRGHARRVAAAAGIEASVALDGDPSVKLPSAVRFGIARAFQEALSNAVRHAGAKTIAARLAITRTGARLRLDDDGCGFDPGAEAAGRGVKGMRARVTELGGLFEIGNNARGGTSVVAELPLVAPATRAPSRPSAQ